MGHDTRQQEEIIDMIIPPKTFAPEENRIQGAASVNNYGDHKPDTIIMPRHEHNLTGTRLILKIKVTADNGSVFNPKGIASCSPGLARF
jgi:hypothetical protein